MIQHQELLRCDSPAGHSPETILHADVVPEAARIAVIGDAIDVDQVSEVAPLDRGYGCLWFDQLLTVDEAVIRVQRQRRKAAPAADALAIAQRLRIRVEDRIAGAQPLDQRASGPALPARVGSVKDIHVELQQLAVAHVNRLCDHVRIGVLGNCGIDQAFVVLTVDVLLDTAARTSDTYRVSGQIKEFDKALLDH